VILDLGTQPLANSFITADAVDEPEPRYPLELCRCTACGHVQLSLTVPAEVMGGRLPEPRVLGIAKNELTEQRLSTEKARRVLGWAPRVKLRDGLRETVVWYRAYLDEQR